MLQGKNPLIVNENPTPLFFKFFIDTYQGS